NTTAARAGFDPALGIRDGDSAAAGFQAKIAIHRANLDAIAASLGNNRNADIIQADLAAAAFGLHAAGDSVYGYAAAGGFDSGECQVAGNINDEFPGTEVMTAALPIAFNPGAVSSGGNVDFVGFELFPGLLFIRSVRTRMNDVTDVLLRAALDADRAEVNANVKVSG